MKPSDLAVNFFKSFPRCAIRHPGRVLGVAVAVILAAIPGLWRIKLRVDGNALVPPNAPEVRFDRVIRDRFGIEDNVVVLISSSQAGGIFNSATVQLVRDLTADFQKLPGINISNVVSLATEAGFRLRPDRLGPAPQTLLEPPLKTKEDLDQLREDLQKIELYNGTLVSADGKTTAILIGVPAGVECLRLYKQVLGIIAAVPSSPDKIAVTGAPVAEALLGVHILEDLGVPETLLGTGTRGAANQDKWKVPASFQDLRLLIAQRIGLIPLAILVMMFILYASFRNLMAMLVPLPGILATLLVVFGLMGWFGVPVYLTIAVMPVLLAATGVANDIYLFTRYFNLLRENPGRKPVELLGETFDALAAPLACTSLTAGVSFLSFGFSPLAPVRAFGFCAGGGMLFGLWCSLTVVPALLALINPACFVSSRPAGERRGAVAFAAGFARLGTVVVARRWWVAVAVLLVAVAMPFGLRRLVVQDSWTGGFDPQSDFSRANRLVDEQFYGMHLLFVSCDATQPLTGEIPGSAVAPGRILLPGNLVGDETILSGCALSIFPVEGPQSEGSQAVRPSAGADSQVAGGSNAPPSTILRTQILKAMRSDNHIVAFTSRGDADTAVCRALSGMTRVRFETIGYSQLDPQIIRAIDALGAFIRTRFADGVGGVLDPADYLRTTRFLLRPNDVNAKVLPVSSEEAMNLWGYYGFVRGSERLHQAVDVSYTRSLTTVFLKDANFVDTARLMGDIRAYEREHLAPLGIKIGFAGDVAVSQSLIHSIVTTQLQSLVWSLLGIFAVTAWFGGSWRAGVFCLLPSLLAVVIKFAVMGRAGIPLGVATSMFAAMTLGIGVNCAIHLLAGCEQSLAAGASPAEAINQALRLTGPPAFVNTLAMSLGFGVLMLSQVPANARLGILLVLGLVNCFVASLLLLPVLLHWWPPNKMRNRPSATG